MDGKKILLHLHMRWHMLKTEFIAQDSLNKGSEGAVGGGVDDKSKGHGEGRYIK